MDDVKEITPKKVLQIVKKLKEDKEDDTLIVDVRDLDTYYDSPPYLPYREGHIPQSIWAPHGCLDCSTDLTNLKKPLDVYKRIILYCNAGYKSQDVGHVWMFLFPDAKVYSLKGGIQAWEKLGYPIESGDSFTRMHTNVCKRCWYKTNPTKKSGVIG